MAESDSITSEVEIWKPITGFEGRYDVSNLGRVRSLTRQVRCRVGYHWLHGRVLKPYINAKRGKGYASLRLGDTKNYDVHTLVAVAFIGPRPEGHECNHKDGNPHNNRADNLEWVTHQANMDHAAKTLGWSNAGSRHGRAKLTEQNVIDMRRLKSEVVPIKVLAVQFGIHEQSVRDICNRKYWTHVI